MTRAVLVGVALLAACTAAETPTAPLEASPASDSAPATVPGLGATVRRVVDGDTIEVEVDGRVDTVRLIGIDTPETTSGPRPPECFGDEASGFATAMLPVGTGIRLLRDVEARDQYDRLLAYVYRDDGTFVNLTLVDQGYAVAYPFEPNTTFAGDFRAAEARARDGRVGLWGRCGGPDVPAGSLAS